MMYRTYSKLPLNALLKNIMIKCNFFRQEKYGWHETNIWRRGIVLCQYYATFLNTGDISD